MSLSTNKKLTDKDIAVLNRICDCENGLEEEKFRNFVRVDLGIEKPDDLITKLTNLELIRSDNPILPTRRKKVIKALPSAFKATGRM